MKSILGILSFDPNVDEHATFSVLSPDTIAPTLEIEWSHNVLDAGRHIGHLEGAFTAGTTGRTGFMIAGHSMSIEGSEDTNDVIIQMWDPDGVEEEVGINTLVEIIVP